MKLDINTTVNYIFYYSPSLSDGAPGTIQSPPPGEPANDAAPVSSIKFCAIVYQRTCDVFFFWRGGATKI